jgi:hypothetical protein
MPGPEMTIGTGSPLAFAPSRKQRFNKKNEFSG